MLIVCERCLISPMQLFRKFPPLQAKKIIGISVVLVNDLPEDLYAELVRHPRN